jgi:hypothetical protein
MKCEQPQRFGKLGKALSYSIQNGSLAQNDDIGIGLKEPYSAERESSTNCGHKTFKPTILQHNEQRYAGHQRLLDLQVNQNYVPRPNGLNISYQELNSFAFQNYEKGFNFDYQSEIRRDSFN